MSPKVISQNVLLRHLGGGDVNVNNKVFRCTEWVRNEFSFAEGDVSIDVKGSFDLFRHAQKWVIIPGAFYNYRQDNISYGRSGFSPVDFNTVVMTKNVAKEARGISEDVYKAACLHIIKAEFNVINKVAIYGFKKNEYKEIYEKAKNSYISDIRKHIFTCLKSNYFHKNDKRQLMVLALSYTLFMNMKSRYVAKHKDEKKPSAIKC